MKSRMLALLACGLLCLGTQARAAINNLITSPNVGDMPGLVVPDFMKTECDWRGSLVRSVLKNSEGAVSVTSDAAKRDVGRVLEAAGYEAGQHRQKATTANGGSASGPACFSTVNWWR